MARYFENHDQMKVFFARNIDGKGRLVRGLLGLALLIGAACTFQKSKWLAGLLAAAGAFCILEALRGWCLLRACRIKTKL